MDNAKNYITEEKKVELEAELKHLTTVKRKEILANLEYAKSLGDLSENAEYHQAREEQGKLEERVVKIEQILRESLISKKHHSSIAEVGSTVTVQKEGTKDQKKYTIVGSEESDMSQGKISNHSPLGVALFGKKKGDIAEFKSPAGVVKYKVVEIE